MARRLHRFVRLRLSNYTRNFDLEMSSSDTASLVGDLSLELRTIISVTKSEVFSVDMGLTSALGK